MVGDLGDAGVLKGVSIFEFVWKVIRDFVTSAGLTVSSSTIFTASVFFEPLAVDRKFRGI